MTGFKVRDSQSPNMLSFPVLCLLVPTQGLCPGATGELTMLCRPPADFFISLISEKAFSLLQTQFGSQKRWYVKVLGKTPAFRPCKVDFLFCISHPHLQETCAFCQFMDILPHLLNLSWPSFFEIEIMSNNFNNEETCSGSLHSFSNKCI